MAPILGIYASQITGHLNPFTPSSSYDALASYTVPSGGVSSITFAGLPTGGQYAHLQLRATTIGTATWVDLSINSSNLNTMHFLGGTGSGSAGAGAYTSGIYQSSVILNNSSPTPSANIIDILDYANTNKNKTIRTITASDSNGSGHLYIISNLWSNTSAVSSLTLTIQSGSFAQNSQFALYGVRG